MVSHILFLFKKAIHWVFVFLNYRMTNTVNLLPGGQHLYVRNSPGYVSGVSFSAVYHKAAMPSLLWRESSAGNASSCQILRSHPAYRPHANRSLSTNAVTPHRTDPHFLRGPTVSVIANQSLTAEDMSCLFQQSHNFQWPTAIPTRTSIHRPCPRVLLC